MLLYSCPSTDKIFHNLNFFSKKLFSKKQNKRKQNKNKQQQKTKHLIEFAKLSNFFFFNLPFQEVMTLSQCHYWFVMDTKMSRTWQPFPCMLDIQTQR